MRKLFHPFVFGCRIFHDSYFFQAFRDDVSSTYLLNTSPNVFDLIGLLNGYKTHRSIRI